jgi:hypothetical protein
MVWFLALTCVLVGCGRLGFDPLDPVRDAPPASIDASPFACPLAATAPDLIWITGQTFQYTSFDNVIEPLPGATVRATTPLQVVQAASDGEGDYAFTLTTGGVPVTATFELFHPDYYTTLVIPDAPLDRDVTGTAVDVWRLGDGPLWTQDAMTLIYETVGVPQDVLAGTLNVAVQDCAGAPIAGITVEISPPPGALIYQTMDGTPSPDDFTATPLSHAIAFNARPGVTTISAHGGGRTFLDQQVVVRAGSFNTLAIIRPVP